MERRCFCPPDTLRPLGDAVVCAPSSALTNSAACESAMARAVFAVASGGALAEEYVVAHRSREENGLLRDIAELIVERIEGIVLDVHRPTSTAPSVAS